MAATHKLLAYTVLRLFSAKTKNGSKNVTSCRWTRNFFNFYKRVRYALRQYNKYLPLKKNKIIDMNLKFSISWGGVGTVFPTDQIQFYCESYRSNPIFFVRLVYWSEPKKIECADIKNALKEWCDPTAQILTYSN